MVVVGVIVVGLVIVLGYTAEGNVDIVFAASIKPPNVGPDVVETGVVVGIDQLTSEGLDSWFTVDVIGVGIVELTGIKSN